MADTRSRLVQCFTAVFPDLSPTEIEQASTATVKAWDSLAHATLVTVVEEEFGIEIAPDDIARLTSFELLLESLSTAHDVR